MKKTKQIIRTQQQKVNEMLNTTTIESCYKLHQLVLELNQLSGDEPNSTWHETGEYAIIEYLPYGQINFILRGSRRTLGLVGQELGFDTKHREFVEKPARKFRNYTLTKQQPRLLTEEHADVCIFENMMPIRATRNHLREGFAIMLFRAGSKDNVPECYIDARFEILKLPSNLGADFLSNLIESVQLQVRELSGLVPIRTPRLVSKPPPTNRYRPVRNAIKRRPLPIVRAPKRIEA